MTRKDLLDQVKDEAESVRLRKQQFDQAMTRRSKAILEAANEGYTYKEIADAAGISIHTIQAELRIARRTQRG